MGCPLSHLMIIAPSLAQHKCLGMQRRLATTQMWCCSHCSCLRCRRRGPWIKLNSYRPTTIFSLFPWILFCASLICPFYHAGCSQHPMCVCAPYRAGCSQHPMCVCVHPIVLAVVSTLCVCVCTVCTVILTSRGIMSSYVDEPVHWLIWFIRLWLLLDGRLTIFKLFAEIKFYFSYKQCIYVYTDLTYTYTRKPGHSSILRM